MNDTPDPDPATALPVYLLILLLVLVCFLILAVGEEAMAELGDIRIKELAENGDKRAKRLVKMTARPRRFAERVRLGQYIGAFLTVCTVLRLPIAVPFGEWLIHLFNVPFSLTNYAVWTYIAIIIVALISIVLLAAFFDRLPRRLAAKKPEKTTLGISGIFCVIYSVLSPIDWLCHIITLPFLRLGKVRPDDDADTVTEEDIREMMDAGEETGAIEGAQKDMVNNVFEFDDITAAEIMTPRTDVTAVEADEPITEVLRACVDNGYSRIPVYEGDIDHVIGILAVKDLLPYVGRDIPTEVTVRRLLRETHFVPDTKKCDELFEEMNEKRLQMAVVVDEYGGVAGIVTMEDLLESIVGNMQDEYDHEEEEITQLDDHTFVIDGSLSIGELEELVNTTLPEGDYDTVAGFLMDQLGHIPEEDENATVVYENITFSIRQMDDRRIERVFLRVEPAAEENAAEE